MRFVDVKRVEQQDIQAVHRIRAELLGQRATKANQLRGLVSEYGLVAPQELCQLRRVVPGWLKNPDDGLGKRIRGLLDGLWADLRGLDERVAELDAEIAAIAEEDPAAQRLQQLRGVGPITATALAAAALANKTARIAWAMLRNGPDYQPDEVSCWGVDPNRSGLTKFSQEPIIHDCQASRTIANRSNRRRQNPRVSTCEKHERPIGSRRANSPSWPGIASRCRESSAP
jgi:hypothetical protein